MPAAELPFAVAGSALLVAAALLEAVSALSVAAALLEAVPELLAVAALPVAESERLAADFYSVSPEAADFELLAVPHVEYLSCLADHSELCFQDDCFLVH